MDRGPASGEDGDVERAEARAQSTVIGVILLVLVTVILAGFVAVFVFDLAERSLQEPTPQVRFSWENTTDGLRATHDGGDPVRARHLEIVVTDDGTKPYAYANETEDPDDPDPDPGNVSRVQGDVVFGNGTVRIGDAAIVAHDVGENDTARIVYVDPDTQRGSLLSNYRRR